MADPERAENARPRTVSVPTMRLPGTAGRQPSASAEESDRDPIYGTVSSKYDDLWAPIGWAPWIRWLVRRQRRRTAQESQEPVGDPATRG
jgi:hypothetical protein